MIDPNAAVDRGDELSGDHDELLDELTGDLFDDDVVEDTDDLETDEERAAREEEEAALERDKRIRIPKGRFDEAVRKERERADALQAKIDALERPQTQTQREAMPSMADIQAHLDTLQDQYEELLIDGMREDAREIRKQMAQIQNYVQDQKLQTIANQAREGTLGTIKYETALAQLEARYPEINPDGDNFDEAIAGEVAELAKAFIAAGHSNIQAVQRATRYVLGEKTATPAVETPNARTTAARTRNAAAAQRQPANAALTGRTASDRTGIDVTRLNQKSFAKLDEQAKSRLRGDEL